MKVSEQIAIMQAYADGKTIEKKGQDDTEWKSIEYIEDYPFDFFCEQYRIKQGYRPFQTIEEAFSEANKHGFWVKEVSSGFLILIDSFSEDYGVVYIVGHKETELLDDFVWADDGSPCGVKIK